MTHTAPCRPYLSFRGVLQIISKSFQVSESKINLIFNTSAHRTGNSSTSTNLHKHCKSEQKQKARARQSHTRKEQPNSRRGKKKQFVQTVAQMFNGLFTNVYTNQQKKKKKDKQLLNLLAITSLEVLGAVVLGALDERPRPFHKVVNQHGPGAFFVIVAHVVCYHTTEI